MEPYTVRVIYGDTDQMGVVYYANYLRFFEGARGHFIRNLGLSYGEIERRSVYGEATPDQAKELHEEGIEFHRKRFSDPTALMA